MTKHEMELVRDILFDCNETLAYFDERGEDKKLLFVTTDEPTLLRYIIASPIATEKEKKDAENLLGDLVAEERERHILFESRDAWADVSTTLQ